MKDWTLEELSHAKAQRRQELLSQLSVFLAPSRLSVRSSCTAPIERAKHPSLGLTQQWFVRAIAELNILGESMETTNGQNTMTFGYLLRPGISQSTNALRLLRSLKFPLLEDF